MWKNAIVNCFWWVWFANQKMMHNTIAICAMTIKRIEKIVTRLANIFVLITRTFKYVYNGICITCDRCIENSFVAINKLIDSSLTESNRWIWTACYMTRWWTNTTIWMSTWSHWEPTLSFGFWKKTRSILIDIAIEKIKFSMSIAKCFPVKYVDIHRNDFLFV